MTPTLLIDLDDTLLVNDINTFLPPYLQALSQHLSSYADPKLLVTQLMRATRKMEENTRPDRTLQQVFEAAFYPAIGRTPEEMRAPIEQFYAGIFPKLKQYTQAIPASVELVEQASARGYRMVVATNPLFPRSAIYHRLAWAGLSPDRYDFDLITSYERFHFTKPNPAYYAEILAYLGWPEGPVIMIGDSLENDIAAARLLGLPAFWLEKDGVQPADGNPAPTANGRIQDVLDWIDRTPAEALQPDYSTPSAMLAILRSTPAALDTLGAGLTNEDWTRKPQAGEWAPAEILCHLRDVEQEVNLPRLQRVLGEENPFIAGKDTDPWADERQYICQSGPQAQDEFTAARVELLALLEGLQPADWQRPARHAIFGPTHLAELVSIIAGHDRLHLQQLTRDVAR